MSIVKIRAALEIALDAMAGIIPSVNISTSTSGTTAAFISASAHGMTTGMTVSISGHVGSTPDLNGTYLFVSTGASAFSLQHPVTKAAIASTANGTGGVLTANLTAWEGVGFAPVAGVAFQRVNLLPATPFNPSFGGNHSRESGYMQVTLYYPLQRGTNAVMTRAELIRSTFPRGSSFTNNGITVHIPKTPEILPGVVQDENFVVPVKVQYWSDIFA